jgi:ABC-type Na+ efflux pump permease subunit
MDIHNVWSVAAKDFETIKRRKSIIYSMLILPFLVSVLFILTVEFKFSPSSGISSDYLGLDYLTFFFVIVAVILPSSLAAYSIVGEKVEKSLEPLLATPITDGEILLGKSVAAFLPPILVTWAGALIFLAASDYVLYSGLSSYYFPSWDPGIMLFLLAPLAAVLGIEIGIIVSSRISDVRSANQLATLTSVPFAIVFVAAITGGVAFDISILLTISLILVIADLVLFYLSTSFFHREEMLTKWK